jgi:4-aminobutyrate aminotransferase-like enzyme
LKNIEIIECERLWETAATRGEGLLEGLQAAFGDQLNTGDIGGGKGLLAAVEFAEDRTKKKHFAPELKFAARRPR